jgi:hypothetical protein
VLGDPQQRLQALRLAKHQHQPLAFVMGSGEYLGAYVITHLSSVLRRASAVGQIQAATVQLSLREYTGAFTRRVSRPGLHDATRHGTPTAAIGSPGLISRPAPSPSAVQRVIHHAKTAGNILQAGRQVYQAVDSGNASMILGRVPQLLGVTAGAIAPLQGLTAAAGLMEDGADVSRLGNAVLAGVMGTRTALHPIDADNIVDRFAASHAALDQALATLYGARTRLADLAAQVLTRQA